MGRMHAHRVATPPSVLPDQPEGKKARARHLVHVIGAGARGQILETHIVAPRDASV